MLFYLLTQDCITCCLYQLNEKALPNKKGKNLKLWVTNAEPDYIFTFN